LGAVLHPEHTSFLNLLSHLLPTVHLTPHESSAVVSVPARSARCICPKAEHQTANTVGRVQVEKWKVGKQSFSSHTTGQ